MFSFEELIIEKGQALLRVGSNAEEILLVERGCIEVSTYFDGNKFVLDRLYPGSIINFR
jgi:CRP-like cAMP-binding protein